MREIDIALRKGATGREIIRAIDVASREAGLTIVSKGSLGKYPGCTHWHLKLKSQPGTLEITYWAKTKRAWFALRTNRYAPWMGSVVPQLKIDIERGLIVSPREVRA